MDSPSLRSSTPRGVECKLRRTDSALHETTQRFVESLANDIRISQYSDLNYACKRFEKEKWYWLSPAGRAGYLVCLPRQPIVWIDEQFKFSYRIQLRVSSSIYEKNSVFIASLDQASCLLRLEDAWIVAGRNLLNDPFTIRWESLLDFYSCQYRADLNLQQNLRVEPAKYAPLNDAKTWLDTPAMMIAQGENYPRRLRVQLVGPALGPAPGLGPGAAPGPAPGPGQKAKPEYGSLAIKMNIGSKSKPLLQKTQKISEKPMFQDDGDVFADANASANTNADANANANAKAVPHAEYPDTYDVWIGGVKKGYAAVQDIKLSLILREAAKASENNEIKVKVEWSDEFSMYEIQGLV